MTDSQRIKKGNKNVVISVDLAAFANRQEGGA